MDFHGFPVDVPWLYFFHVRNHEFPAMFRPGGLQAAEPQHRIAFKGGPRPFGLDWGNYPELWSHVGFSHWTKTQVLPFEDALDPTWCQASKWYYWLIIGDDLWMAFLANLSGINIFFWGDDLGLEPWLKTNLWFPFLNYLIRTQHDKYEWKNFAARWSWWSSFRRFAGLADVIISPSGSSPDDDYDDDDAVAALFPPLSWNSRGRPRIPLASSVCNVMWASWPLRAASCETNCKPCPVWSWVSALGRQLVQHAAPDCFFDVFNLDQFNPIYQLPII